MTEPCEIAGCWALRVFQTQPHIHVYEPDYPWSDYVRAIQHADHAWQLGLFDGD